MKKIVLFFEIILILVLFSHCTSGKRAFQRGDYERAIDLSVDRLRSNPTHEKSQQTLKNAYTLLVEQKTAEINNLKIATQAFKWDKIVENYNTIHNVGEQIKGCPGAWAVVKNPVRFDQELVEANGKASLEHYEAGLIDLQIGTQEKARSAYNHFSLAQSLYPNFKPDYLLKKNEAKRKATIVVGFLVEKNNRIDFTNEVFRGKINEYVLELDKREFLDTEVLQNMDAESDVNDIVKIELVDFNQDNLILKETKESMRDTVNHEVVNPNTNLKEIRKMAVFADVSTFRKSQRFYGNIEITIYDAASKQILFTKPLQDEYIWQTEWAKAIGDMRALNKKQASLANKQEEFPLAKQQFFNEFSKNIFPKVQQVIQQYYNKN
ncbi:MAG: hypothetical protein EAZ85_01525 [Bacteroidetes bacterium]|nr:MAG: hypothetical protein EAZ85_01525 [Bacteroidota bacterium]TAG87951.1 MAG: hypothetical protein EAZ20_09575 [Bacteroidota bacterium]